MGFPDQIQERRVRGRKGQKIDRVRIFRKEKRRAGLSEKKVEKKGSISLKKVGTHLGGGRSTEKI